MQKETLNNGQLQGTDANETQTPNAKLITAELLDVLTLALPYVEMAELDEAYKKGAVKKVINQMVEVIQKATRHKETLIDGKSQNTDAKDQILIKLMEQNKQLIETLIGTAKALQRTLDKYNADDLEYEWIGNANEIITECTGKNLRKL